ncbi:MAG TPA: hypothetical protein VEW48_16800 [Thermoanaerobaculia bacterium]|nr:hypothetical protein [Thermoanaerobaculia bacterium]
MSKKTRTRFMLLSLMAVLLALVSTSAAPVEAAFNCKLVSCPPPACEPGEHTEVPPGQCCPVCVPD